MLFTHSLLWSHPIGTMAFFALGMGFLSLWIRKSPWFWASFFAIGLIAAFEAQIITPIAILPLSLLIICHALIKRNRSPLFDLSVFLIIIAISMGLWFHLFPGFCNWPIAPNQQISPCAPPYSLWLNFDKPWIGIYILVWSLPLLQSRQQWQRMLKVALPITLVGIGLLLYFSYSIGLITWDPKIPVTFFIWTFANLFLVVIPEEAFLRGFVQRHIFKHFGGTAVSAALAILVTSLLFTFLHLHWISDLPFLGMVFFSGILYGLLFHITGAIESAILCHFTLNLLHFTFFTYPLLK